MTLFQEVTIVQGLLIGLWSGLALAGQLFGIYTNRAIILSFGVGVILGDIPTALAIGGMAELAFMGFGVGPGGSVPPNPLGPGIVGTLMAITMKDQGVDVAQAFALSYPFAIAFQFVITATYTVVAGIPEKVKQAIEEGNMRKYKLLASSSIYAFLIVGFLIGFIASASTDLLSDIVSYIPEWLMTGLTVAGGMLPAIGFALILSMMLKIEYIGYALLGYVFVAYFSTPVMGVAIVAGAFAAIDLAKSDKQPIIASEEEFEDGI